MLKLSSRFFLMKATKIKLVQVSHSFFTGEFKCETSDTVCNHLQLFDKRSFHVAF